jgi:hypothetical protein
MARVLQGALIQPSLLDVLQGNIGGLLRQNSFVSGLKIDILAGFVRFLLGNSAEWAFAQEKTCIKARVKAFL